jgi:glutamate 5-kinase
VDTSQTGTQWGTGGMATKLTAARLATAAGCRMAICLASEPERMLALLAGDKTRGTVFHPHPNMLRWGKGSALMCLCMQQFFTLWHSGCQQGVSAAIESYQDACHAVLCRGKLRWILSVAVKGTLWIDNGALAAVLDRRKSLFAAGITKVGSCISSLNQLW